MLRAIIASMRPKQWTKNGFVYFALFFDRQVFHLVPFLRTTAGFVLFCIVSGVVYIINDIEDVEADRHHPTKRNRPIPSGKLPIRVAWTVAVVLLVISLALGYVLAPAFAVTLAVYFALNLAYSLRLKHVPILDVIIIALGFVLRVHGGVTLITVERFSPWLYVVTTLGALYIGLGKRRSELSLLAEGAGTHRPVLDGYTLPLLDQYITIVSATTIVAYSLYTFSAPNLPTNHTMMLTIPFAIYSVFRYLYIIQVTHAAGAPEDVILTDRPLQVSIVLWGLAMGAVFYLSNPV
jgi:4-hydroxybenzoate polyprenyltransferase